MNLIQKIFKQYGPQYLTLYADRMPAIHKKAIKDITECRSGSFGTLVYGCHDCKNVQVIPCCCGNRNCPGCQHDKTDHWLNKQVQNLLPGHYFLVTITLPQGLRKVTRSNQRAVYGALFSSAYKALKKLAHDKRFVGSTRIGYLAVLHTWGSMLQYHPHLHLVIPGGALSENADQWMPSRQDLFVHTKPLAIIFKAKFRDAMKKSQLYDQIDASVWRQQWVIDSQAVGSGHNSLRYLSRYVFRVAISNNRIISFDNNTIKFRYKDRKKKKWRTMELNAMEFIRRFLQHVLPKRFMKIRHYGFLNCNSSVPIEKIRELIAFIQDVVVDLLPEVLKHKKPGLKCSCCGQLLEFIAYFKPEHRWRPAEE